MQMVAIVRFDVDDDFYPELPLANRAEEFLKGDYYPKVLAAGTEIDMSKIGDWNIENYNEYEPIETWRTAITHEGGDTQGWAQTFAGTRTQAIEFYEKSLYATLNDVIEDEDNLYHISFFANSDQHEIIVDFRKEV